MAAGKDRPARKGAPGRAAPAPAATQNKPDWADGLRALYDAVVEEPLPDSFKDLLNRLDDPSANGSA